MIRNRSRNERRRFIVWPIAVLILAAFLLQACGGATPSPTAVVVNPTEIVATTQPAQAPTTPPTEVNASATVAMAATSGTLRVAMQPIVQTDPAFISSDAEVLVANAVFDYLVDVTPQNTIAPRLATKWDISQDGLTYVFSLADGVTFKDGSKMSANDVVWTFNRLRDPATDSPTKDLYSNIADIQATGDLEVTFTLKEPNPFFLYDLSDNHALILKANTGDPGNFNGTGPFRVTTYSPEDRIVLTANPDYFIKEEPKLSGFEIIFFNDESAQVDALRSNQVDLVMRLSTDLYTSLKDQSGLTLFEVPTNQFDLIRLRADEKPGNDPRVIQALKLATDREAIFQLVLQGYGRIGRDSPIGPMYTQYYSEDTRLPQRDVEAAKKLLADAGYPDGLSLDLHVPDTGVRPNLAVALKDQWSEAGVTLNVIVEPESVYYGDNGWLAVDLGITGWGSRPYPQFYLDTMLTCNAVWNEAHWCDSEFDQLAKDAGTTMDEQQRVNDYKEIQRILIERGPVIIPYFTTQLGAINDQFKGFEMKPFPGRSDFREVTFSGS